MENRMATTFTTKHYESIATILWEAQADIAIVEAFMEALGLDNPRFNHHRFRNACLNPFPISRVVFPATGT